MNAYHEQHQRTRGALRLLAEPMRHADASCWLVLLASLDIMLTWLVLAKGGVEVNPIARQVIATWGLPGVVCFKFVLTAFVIYVCEHIARARPATSRRLAIVCLAISSLPVSASLLQLTAHHVMVG